MPNKKVLITSNSTWATYHFRKDLVARLISDGYEVFILSPYDKYADPLIKLGVKFHPIDIDRKSVNIIGELKLFISLFEIYKKINPSMVLHYSIKPNIYGSIVCGIMNINSIAVVTGLGYVFINRNIKSFLGRFLYRIAAYFTKYMCFLNTSDRDLFVKSGIISKSKTKIIPGEGVDTSFYKSRKNMNSAYLFDFIFIGRMLRDKGILEYIDAAKFIKKNNQSNISFGIIGQVDENPSSVNLEQIKEWEKQKIIEYLEVTDDIKSVIQVSKCIVLPSYREGLPRSLLEASSMEKVVIGTNVAGCKDVIDDNVTGFICRPKSSSSLAKAMLKVLLLSNSQSEKMGSLGRKKVKSDYSNQQVYKAYNKILNLF
jgi:glycosyltransferase involved in cell wall biosynthesis